MQAPRGSSAQPLLQRRPDRLDALVAGVGGGVVAVALAGLTLVGVGPLAAGVFAVQVVTALAWLAVLGVKGGGGVFVCTLITTGVMDGLLGTSSTPDIGRAAGVLGVAIAAGLLFQLVRRPRVEVAASFAGAVSAGTFALSAGCYVALRIETGGDKAVAAALLGTGAALAVGRLVDVVLPHPAAAPGSRRGVTGVITGMGAAALVGWGYGGHEPVLGSDVGLRLAAFTAILAVAVDLAVDVALTSGARGADVALTSETRAGTRTPSAAPVGILLPIVLAAPAAYVVGRLLLG